MNERPVFGLVLSAIARGLLVLVIVKVELEEGEEEVGAADDDKTSPYRPSSDRLVHFETRFDGERCLDAVNGTPLEITIILVWLSSPPVVAHVSPTIGIAISIAILVNQKLLEYMLLLIWKWKWMHFSRKEPNDNGEDEE